MRNTLTAIDYYFNECGKSRLVTYDLWMSNAKMRQQAAVRSEKDRRQHHSNVA